jgi:hypothetical protein
MQCIDGRKYEGEYKYDKMDGQGTMVNPCPEGIVVYKGQFKNSKRHGFGSITYPSGDIYDGMWSTGKKTGIVKILQLNCKLIMINGA